MFNNLLNYLSERMFFSAIAISCFPLDTSFLGNGTLTYSTGSVETVEDQYGHGATATYQCDSGYELTGGDTVRTCTGDGSSPVGQWNGTASVCKGKQMISVCICCTLMLHIHVVLLSTQIQISELDIIIGRTPDIFRPFLAFI